MPYVEIYEADKIKKLILVILMFLVIGAHTVRILAVVAAPHSGGDALAWASSSPGGVLINLNAARRGLGNKIRGISSHCPTKGNSICEATVDGLVLVIGLS